MPPSPAPGPTVAVKLLPRPPTPGGDARLTPGPATTKSPASTLLTLSLKVTWKPTLPRLVVTGLARAIDTTVGAAVSIKNALLAASEPELPGVGNVSTAVPAAFLIVPPLRPSAAVEA